MMMPSRSLFIVVMALMGTLLLTACADKSKVRSPIQIWDDIEIAFETRPTQPRPGMNEVFVFASTKQGRKPVDDVLITVSVIGLLRKKQAIQDGQTGVFRTAMPFRQGLQQMLIVVRKPDGSEGQLIFNVRLD